MERYVKFGKYIGWPITKLIQQDPDYALWAHRTVNGFDLTVLEYYAVETELKFKDKIPF